MPPGGAATAGCTAWYVGMSHQTSKRPERDEWWEGGGTGRERGRDVGRDSDGRTGYLGMITTLDFANGNFTFTDPN